MRCGAWTMVALLASGSVAVVAAKSVVPNLQRFRDPAGLISTYITGGSIRESTSAFFQDLGTNGRSCATCHVPSQALSFTSAGAQARFDATAGEDPLFAPVDGANCPDAIAGDPESHSLILQNGLIRVGLDVPAGAEFKIAVASDPYGCALVTNPQTGVQTVSVYRRPLPGTNLRYLSAVMWDGRETIRPLDNPESFAANLIADLKHQALDATLGHAQASVAPTDAQLSSMVAAELAFSTAQIQDNSAGYLNAGGAKGGAMHLSKQKYYPGINDSLDGNPTGAQFNPEVFTIYKQWEDSRVSSRAAIAAGEKLFNTFRFNIRGVRGLNNSFNSESIQGTCSTCHDTPNVGNHSLPVPLDIGTSHALGLESDASISAGLANLSNPNLPVYKITGCTNPVSGSPVEFYTSDPGRALISGKCVDVNRIKGPILRGLAARAPYFHNGSAASLSEVVNFYNDRFRMGLTEGEKADIVAFLNSL